MRLILLAALLSSCTVTMARGEKLHIVQVNALEGILEQPGEWCYRTIYGMTVYAQNGVACPHYYDIERETEWMLQATQASEDTFEGTRLILTGAKFIMVNGETGQRGWAVGAAPGSTIVIDVSNPKWRGTLRHELEHRRRRILYENGRAPADLSPAAVQTWLVNHKPESWWGYVERGAP